MFIKTVTLTLETWFFAGLWPTIPVSCCFRLWEVELMAEVIGFLPPTEGDFEFQASLAYSMIGNLSPRIYAFQTANKKMPVEVEWIYQDISVKDKVTILNFILISLKYLYTISFVLNWESLLGASLVAYQVKLLPLLASYIGTKACLGGSTCHPGPC